MRETYQEKQLRQKTELKRVIAGEFFFLSLPPGHMNRHERRKEKMMNAAKGRTYRKRR